MGFIKEDNRIGLGTLLISLMATSAFIKLTDASMTIDSILKS
jgi:hypothetical protein